nr:unnamed protein product [Callosobruchus analis]
MWWNSYFQLEHQYKHEMMEVYILYTMLALLVMQMWSDYF